MQLDHVNTKVGFFGMSSYGKTPAWARFILNSNYDGYFIWDHAGQFTHRCGAVVRCQSKDDLLRQWEETRFVICRPFQIWPGRMEVGWRWFCNWAFAQSEALDKDLGRPTKKLIAGDEFQLYERVGFPSYEAKVICETGKIWGLDMAICSLAPNAIPDRICAQLTDVVTFKLQSADQRKALVEAGFHFDKDAVLNLQRGQYLYRNAAGDSSEGRIF